MSREKLGGFISIVCFKGVITGMEEALGEKATAIALTSAGRTRGKNLATELGLAGANSSLEDLASKLDHALGENGTRLCKVDRIEDHGDVIKVYTHETVCSAGEPQGSSRQCTYSLGAVWGAIETIQGKRYRGKHTESVLRGGSYDVFELTPLG
ncbi:MAG: hydrocarbon-binding protein, partial [Waterburya sp.]